MVIESQLGPDANRQCDVFFRRAGILIEPLTVERGHLARQAFWISAKAAIQPGCFTPALAKVTADQSASLAARNAFTSLFGNLLLVSNRN